MVGATLATRYRIDAEIGRGGMAAVYRARDLRLGRPVAVKVMHPTLGSSARERFRREAAIVASLKHANIVEIYDFGEEPGGAPFLVTELVEGESLRQLAERIAPVPPEAAAVLAWEVARALAAAHGRGVVHRDVKPENVLVAPGGPLKLADFGIAAAVDQERLTSTGAITGSLPYMAPERIDTGAYSPASDVYAVGVIAFELCAGRTPFSGKGAAALAAAALTRDAPPLLDVAPAVPLELASLVAKCLARDARDRPADGAALDTALADVVSRIAGPPAEESRALFSDPRAYAADRRARRFQALLREAETLLAAGQGARAAQRLDAALALNPESSEVRALLRRRAAARRPWIAAAAAAAVLAAAGIAALAMRPARAPESPAAPVPPAPVASVPPPAEQPPPFRPAEAALDSPPRSPQAPNSIGQSGAPASPPSRLGTAARSGSGRRSSAPAATGPPVTTIDPAPAAPATPATLLVSTRPWAEVFVDGKSHGYTPRLRELTLPPGRHRVRFANPLCDAVEEEIDLAPGATLAREVALVARKSELLVDAPAGAAVFLDGVQVGVAPLREPLRVEHGRHTVTARVPGATPLTRDVEVIAGQRGSVVLERAP